MEVEPYDGMLPPVIELQEDGGIVWNYTLGSFLYSKLGFYGKPLGERKVDPGYINRPFVLSLFEMLYLNQIKIIKVTRQQKILSSEEILKFAETTYENFHFKYRIYEELRNLGYIVRPGMKFGSDFIVYRKGPGIDHSEYVVHVEDSETEIKAINVVRAGRLATSVRKTYLIGITDNSDSVSFLKLERVKI